MSESRLTLPRAPRGVLRTSGGTYDRKAGVFFPAISQRDMTKHVPALLERGVPLSRFLIAYNEMPGSSGQSWWENTSGLEKLGNLPQLVIDHGIKVFLDSGVFTFCHDYGRATGVHGSEVFAYREARFGDTMATYEAHYGAYVSRIKHLLWGAVEIDLGSVEERTARRQRMATGGAVLIPVFRPETDTLEYLEELMSTYDRICMPVTVKMLPNELRWALVAKAVEMQRTRFPYCYIHVLGSAPVYGWVALASQSGSCDSSTWTNPGRFGSRPTYALSHSIQLPGVEGASQGYTLTSMRGEVRASCEMLQSSSLANMATFLPLNLP